MKIIKRSGQEVAYDISKIIAAVRKANNSVVDTEKMTDRQIDVIADNMIRQCEKMNRSLSVEEIQDMVENEIMNQRAFTVARSYITYRYRRALVRKANREQRTAGLYGGRSQQRYHKAVFTAGGYRGSP